jgi:hypothetical protein
MLETAGGSTGELGGLIVSLFLSYPLHANVFCVFALDDDCAPGSTQRGFAVVLASMSVGETLGVFLSGTLSGGQGQLLPTIGGAALGTGTGLLFAAANRRAESAPLLISALVAPTVGAILGYEVSAAFSSTDEPEPPLRPESSLRLIPVMGSSPGGGLIGGVAGHF